MRVAVVGAGISGLACAYELQRVGGRTADGAPIHVTLFEAAARLGGHTNTVDIVVDGIDCAVDTGFLVFNQRTYPQLIALFKALDVAVAESDMSFSVSLPRPDEPGRRLEWAGSNLRTIFAQKRNLASPRFLRMLADTLRFNRQATDLARAWRAASAAGQPQTDAGPTLGEFLDANGYGAAMRDWYLMPMAAAIWSCPIDTMPDYPLRTFVTFCDNHGLLQVNDRPPWFTVRGGARHYVEAIARQLPDVRLGEAVEAIRRGGAGATPRLALRTGRATAAFDHIVLACHSDQAAALLGSDADSDQRAIAAAIRYQPNRAVLHTDTALMPQTPAVWSAWNYLSDGGNRGGNSGGTGASDHGRVSVSYWLNRLQPLPVSSPVLLSLNPLVEPAPAETLGTFDYAHPVFDAAAIRAQQRLAAVQGRDGIWFAGAWTGFGFHEDGLKSGLAAARGILQEATSETGGRSVPC